MDSQSRLFNNLSISSQQILKKGLKLLGPVTGAYLGSLSSNPESVMIAAAVGDAIAQNMNDFAEKHLSQKESKNISITEIFSIAKILENQDKGGFVNDKLLNNQISGNAYEMYHGILTAAKNNYEDKKLELIGRFYGNIIFIDWLEPYFFHILLSTLNNLNYKQLCILAVIGLHEDFEKQLKSLEDLQGRDNWYETRLIQNELSNMIATGLLEPHNTALMTYVGHRHLNNCRLGLVGELLFKICELDVIDKEDLEDIVNKFI